MRTQRNTTSKPAEIKSVSIKNQRDYSTCYAHAITRNFVRTLQILGIIKAEYNERFYLLFLYIITEKIHLDCQSGGGNWTYSFDLLECIHTYISNNTLFTIKIPNKLKCYDNTCIGGPFFLSEIQLDEQQRIKDDFKLVYQNLHIAKYIYKVDYTDNTTNKPSEAIKQLLKWRLQPYIGFRNFGNCTTPELYGHAVNLRSWIGLSFEIKNSWGTEWNESINGNKVYSNITEISNYQNNTIIFSSLIFDFDNLQPKFKTNVTHNIALFNNCNISDDIKDIKINNFNALPSSIKYGFMNGGICKYDDSKDKYTGYFSFGVFIHGTHTRKKDKTLFNGKFEKEIFQNGDIKILRDLNNINEFSQIERGTFKRITTIYMFTYKIVDGIIILKIPSGLVIQKYENSVRVKYYSDSNPLTPLSGGFFKGFIHIGNTYYHAKRDSQYNVTWECSVKCLPIK